MHQRSGVVSCSSASPPAPARWTALQQHTGTAASSQRTTDDAMALDAMAPDAMVLDRG